MLDFPALLPDLEGLYEDLHAHPELSFAEHRTAAILADRLQALGYEVTTGVGGTGVVATLVERRRPDGAHPGRHRRPAREGGDRAWPTPAPRRRSTTTASRCRSPTRAATTCTRPG